MIDASEMARRLCRNLTHEVQQVVPRTVRGWDGASAIVSDATAAFVSALVSFESSPTYANQSRLAVAYIEVVLAWYRARDAFEREGQAVS